MFETNRRRSSKQLEQLLQGRLATLTVMLLTIATIAALVMFFFEGFHTGGFNLPESLMHWLGVATIGSIGGLSCIVYRAVFPPR